MHWFSFNEFQLCNAYKENGAPRKFTTSYSLKIKSWKKICSRIIYSLPHFHWNCLHSQHTCVLRRKTHFPESHAMSEHLKYPNNNLESERKREIVLFSSSFIEEKRKVTFQRKFSCIPKRLFVDPSGVKSGRCSTQEKVGQLEHARSKREKIENEREKRNRYVII